MPRLPSAPGTLRVNLKGLQASTPWQNTVFLNGYSAKPEAPFLTTVAQGVSTAWNTHWGPMMPTHTTLNQVEVIDIGFADGAVGYDNTTRTGSRVGTQTLPVSAAICVSEKVSLRWRGGHPRFYLPAPWGSDLTGGRTLVSAYVTLLNTAADAFRSALNALSVGGSALALVAVRYYDQHVLLTSPMVLAVTEMNVRTRLDTQRRRLGKELT